LLIVRNGEDPRSGLVLFVVNNRIVTTVPENYQSLSPQ
jgi:hypothetical protein